MCRLVAYLGRSIKLELLVSRPNHSLIVQSQLAEEAKIAVNGDGFGLAWYGENQAPVIYKENMPAWTAPNLQQLCGAIQSHNFLAHVRASTFGGPSYQNCHPFAYRNWSFAHNGQIGGFAKLRRPLEAELDDELFEQRLGITDSELLFLLLVQNGLNADPTAASIKTIRQIEKLRSRLTIHQPLKLTYILCNGSAIMGCRYSSDGYAPTLYFSRNFVEGGTVFASEPLESDDGEWTPVTGGTFVSTNGSSIDIHNIETHPKAAA